MAYQAFNPYAPAASYGVFQPAYAPFVPNANAQQGFPQAQQAAAQNTQPMQMMTPPTIRAEIVQVDDLGAIERCPQAPGTSQMYMTKDEEHIAVRSMLANGEHTDVIYDRRPPEPPAPKFDPEAYVRRDEIAALIAEAIQAQTPAHRSAKTAKTEEAE